MSEMSESEDVFTEVTHESWGGRLKNSCGGICFGIALLIASVPLLVWNEGRSVRRFRTISEGIKVVVPIQSGNIDASKEGSLVHISGVARAGSAVVDPQFGVTASGVLKLRRDVDMYQWVQHKKTTTRKKAGGGKETTTRYTYKKDWRSDHIDSDRFIRSNGHYNPPLSIESFEVAANPISVGAFSIPRDMVNVLSWYTPLLPTSLSTNDITDESIRARSHIDGGGFYLGNDPYYPQVGDIRVEFESVVETPVSILARQTGSTLSPYSTKAGKGSIFIVKQGNLSAQEMFIQANQDNKSAAWLLRGVGFLAMFIGFTLITGPLSVAADVLPCLGDMVECATGFVSFVLALILSAIIIALGWIAYRPFLALGVVAIGGGIIAGMFLLKKKSKENSSPESTPILQVAQPVDTYNDDEIVVKPVPPPPIV